MFTHPAEKNGGGYETKSCKAVAGSRRNLRAGAVLSLLTGGNGQAAEKPKCIACHEKVTPGVVKQFLAGKMGKAGMDCSACHGFDHMSADDVAKVKLPTPDTCAKCHEKRVKEYREGKHALAWAAMKAMPMINHQPSAVGGGDLKGCSACHKVGEKPASDLKRYGTGACDSCHTRHTFSVVEARDP